MPPPLATARPPSARPAPGPSPAVSPSPSPSDPLAEERRQGEERLERALVGLERRSALLRQRIRVYEEGCRGSFSVMGCTGLKLQIEGLWQEIGADLQAAEDSARRSWVYPGTVREIRQRHGLDAESWRELTKGLREALQ